jgi:hypothetical protein
MDINYAIDAGILSLEAYIVLYSSQVISQVLLTSGASP